MFEKLNEVLALFTPKRWEISVSEAVQLLGKPKSTVYRLLARIHEAGFLDQDEISGRYRVGIRLAALGDLARQATSLQRTALPVLRQLSDRFGEMCDLTVLAGSDAVVIEVVESIRAIMVPGLLGRHVPIHATASGKVLVAWKSTEERLRILRPPFEQFTERTITELPELLEELDRTRDIGYAATDSEWVPELVAVSAPVRNYKGEIVAAVAVGGPRIRLNDSKRDDLVEGVLSASSFISRALGYAGDDTLLLDGGRRRSPRLAGR